MTLEFVRLLEIQRDLYRIPRGMVWLKSEPWMNPLRVDPRYADLVKRVGFPR